MIPDEELRKIANTALELTAAGRLPWKESSGEIIKVSFPKSTLSVKPLGRDNFNRLVFTLEVYNVAGELVGTLKPNAESDRVLLQKLYGDAHGNARKVDQTLNDLWEGLDGLKKG